MFHDISYDIPGQTTFLIIVSPLPGKYARTVTSVSRASPWANKFHFFTLLGFHNRRTSRFQFRNQYFRRHTTCQRLQFQHCFICSVPTFQIVLAGAHRHAFGPPSQSRHFSLSLNHHVRGEREHSYI